MAHNLQSYPVYKWLTIILSNKQRMRSDKHMAVVMTGISMQILKCGTTLLWLQSSESSSVAFWFEQKLETSVRFKGRSEFVSVRISWRFLLSKHLGLVAFANS